MKRWILSLALFLGMSSIGSATNAISVIGVGAKSKGMGGVGVAFSQDAFAPAMNPAGLTCIGNRFDLGLGWVWQEGRATIITMQDEGTISNQTKSNLGFWLPEVALSWEPCPCQFVGLAVYTRAAAHTEYSRPIFSGDVNPLFFYYNLFITPSWACRLNSIHSIGVALNIAFDEIEIRGVQSLIASSVHPNDISNNGLDSGEGFSFSLGWTGQFSDIVRVGATFQSTTWSYRHKKYQGFLADEGTINLPPEVAVGIAWQSTPCVTIAADFAYRLWQASVQFDNTSREQGEIGEGFGQTFGPGFGWKNQAIVKIGLSWTVWPCLILRGGYNFGESPIPASETLLNGLLLSTQEHHLSAGATFRSWCGELTLFYYHAFENRTQGWDSTANPNVEWNLRNQQNVAGISYGRCF